ncbi:MAG: HEPN domain-containing protein [Candidatus Hydrogenedentes bacterium]|nr:HEPN domain-containing protein [Candidatus Hydrogenedentota bacterium]
MNAAQRDRVRGWLIKAKHDLASACKLAKAPDQYLDVAIYHCQQAAEKAIKGFLVSEDIAFDWTHDLEPLLQAASKCREKFKSWLDVAERLTQYGTIYRYPDDIMEPTADEFESAYAAANELVEFVRSLLPWAIEGEDVVESDESSGQRKNS